jgi:hypothetical protein
VTLTLALPDRLSWRGRSVRTASAAFWLAASGALAAETLIELRRATLFGRGLKGNPFGLEDPGESIAFLIALPVAQLCLAWLLLSIVRLCPRRTPASEGLVAFDFLAVAALLTFASLSVKSRLTGFFADRLTLDLARELGGGSLLQALLYVVDEVLVLAAGLVPLVLLVWLVRRRLRPVRFNAPTAPKRRRWTIAAALLAVSLSLAWAARDPAARSQLERFVAPRFFYAALGAVSDPDGDGSSLFSDPPDPYPFDSARHPLALDVPGNGVDEDGFGGDLAPAHLPRAALPRFAGERRHVVLVVLESTRADAIGKRWDGRLVAPNLTALAAAGTSARHAYSNFSLTRRSMKTIFTGQVLPAPGAPSLFRDFRAAGYRVAVLSSQAEDYAGIAEATGMREVADIFVDAGTLSPRPTLTVGRNVVDAGLLLGEWDRRLGDRRGWDRPTFVYLNIQTPHFPYAAPEVPGLHPSRRPLARRDISFANRDAVIQNYWNSVAYADRLLGQLIARLRSASLWEETTLIVVADHGEELFDDGYLGHGTALNAVQTRVPLVFSTRIELPALVGHEDLRALILRAAGAEMPEPASDEVLQLLGHSARPALLGLVRPGGRFTVFEPSTGEVRAPDGSARTTYSELAAQDPARAAIDRLVERWMRERWAQHVAARAVCRAAWSPTIADRYDIERRDLCGSD